MIPNKPADNLIVCPHQDQGYILTDFRRLLYMLNQNNTMHQDLAILAHNYRRVVRGRHAC